MCGATLSVPIIPDGSAGPIVAAAAETLRALATARGPANAAQSAGKLVDFKRPEEKCAIFAGCVAQTKTRSGAAGLPPADEPSGSAAGSYDRIPLARLPGGLPDQQPRDPEDQREAQADAEDDDE